MSIGELEYCGFTAWIEGLVYGDMIVVGGPFQV